MEGPSYIYNIYIYMYIYMYIYKYIEREEGQGGTINENEIKKYVNRRNLKISSAPSNKLYARVQTF